MKKLAFHILVALFFCITTFTLYYTTLECDTYYDSKNFIDNIISPVYYRFGTEGYSHLIKNSRPIPALTLFWNHVNHSFISFRIFNIIIHIINSFLCYWLFLHMLNFHYENISEKHRRFIAFCSAALFCTHPISVQCVTYIVQRMTSLCLCFFLSGMICFIHAQNSKKKITALVFYIFTGIFCVLAVLSKQVGILLPFCCIAYHLCFYASFTKRMIRIIVYCSLSVASVIVFLSDFLFENSFNKVQDFHLFDFFYYDFSPYERVLTQFRIFFYYISLYFFPHSDRLSLCKDFSVSRGFLHPYSTLICFLAIFVIICAALKYRKKYPFLCFTALWFCINVSVEAAPLPLHLVFDHRIYIPGLFFNLITVLFLYKIFSKKYFSPMICGFTLLSCLIFSKWTIDHNMLFKDPSKLWKHCYNNYPDSAEANKNYGICLYKYVKDHKLALHHLNRALKIVEKRPLFTKSGLYRDVGNAYFFSKDYENAIKYYRLASVCNKFNTDPYFNLANIYYEEKYYDEVIDMMKNVINIDNRKAEPYLIMAVIYKKQEKPINEINALIHALETEKYNIHIRVLLQLAFLKNNMLKKALWLSRESLEYFPHSVELLMNTGTIYKKMNDLAAAEKYYLSAGRRHPHNPEILNNLGVLYINAGKPKYAVAYLKKAISIEPEYHVFYKNIAEAYKVLGQRQLYKVYIEKYNTLLKKLDNSDEKENEYAEKVFKIY